MCVFASSQLQQQRRLFIPTLHILRGFPRGAITTTRKKKSISDSTLFLFCIVVVTMRSHWIMKLLLASWVSLMKFYEKFNNHLSSLSAPFDINCYEILYNKNQKGTKPSWVGVHTSEFAIIHTNKDMNRQRTIKKIFFASEKKIEENSQAEKEAERFQWFNIISTMNKRGAFSLRRCRSYERNVCWGVFFMPIFCDLFTSISLKRVAWKEWKENRRGKGKQII